MLRDIRATSLFKEAEALARLLRQPGTGRITEALEIDADRDGRRALVSGVITDRLEGTPPTRVCLIDAETAGIRVLTFGPNSDRSPKFSPDGSAAAFLSDRDRAGDFQLYHLDPESGVAAAAPRVDGWVEYFHWAADGKRILLGVAGHGADIAGPQGAVTSDEHAPSLPAWMPSIETGDESFRWRSAWIYDIEAGTVQKVSQPDLNVWEASWCGPDALVAVTSPGPSEDAWYDADLRVIDIESGSARVVFTSADQIGWPSASPSGQLIAVVEAVSSDRGAVAGVPVLIDRRKGEIRRIDTGDADVTFTHWSDERLLRLGAIRDTETVMFTFDGSRIEENWSIREVTPAGRYLQPCFVMGSATDCLFLAEDFRRPCEIGRISNGRYRSIVSFDAGSTEEVLSPIGRIEHVAWTAPDGLEIHGWLLTPRGEGPFATVLDVHGGPVAQWKPRWWASRDLAVLMLIRHGYAVFRPNPRGSCGRGQDYARKVKGDMGGADVHDHLSGLDHLVALGLTDPVRIGVMGGSYGGFMTAQLVTRDQRFAAAISWAPHVNQISQHLTSNIARFDELFLGDRYDNAGGRYFDRSPVMFANRVRTPTLNIAGALDRCTPASQAVEFHNALLFHGAKSALAVYPEEGHGIRKMPAYFDYAARTVSWFEEHMPAANPERA